jgi:hypothetical protein
VTRLGPYCTKQPGGSHTKVHPRQKQHTDSLTCDHTIVLAGTGSAGHRGEAGMPHRSKGQ